MNAVEFWNRIGSLGVLLNNAKMNNDKEEVRSLLRVIDQLMETRGMYNDKDLYML